MNIIGALGSGGMGVWWRGVNDRKREVEEKAKQLEQVASLSALIAGFALVSMLSDSREKVTTDRQIFRRPLRREQACPDAESKRREQELITRWGGKQSVAFSPRRYGIALLLRPAAARRA
eukprot:jgi/Undpi1/13773/HiC_scaffold_9.g03424.m1